MTDINDYSSPHDAADEARAEDPPDDYGRRPPLDLDDLQKLYDLAEEPGGLPAWGRIVYLEVPTLIAELREARRRIAEFEALEKREEWSWSEDPAAEPTPGAYKFMSAKSAFAFAAGRPVWQRTLTVRPWQPIAPDAPF